MIDTSDFRNGMTFMLEGDIHQILEFQHYKPGKGGAMMRTRLRNLRSGAITDRTFRAGEKFEQAILERKALTYLYSRDGEHFFMDMETFDQVPLQESLLGDKVKYLKENMEVEVLMHGEKIIGAEIPFFLELEVTETDPGLRGDTASGGSKPAKVETGAVVQVPLFINVGDKIKVDTRTDNYLERVK